jgi:hypothetical protein
VDSDRLAFFDEKKFLSNATPTYGLALPNVTPMITVDREIFSDRYDVLDSCVVEGVGPISIITPEDRHALGVKGIGSAQVEGFFLDKLLPFLGGRVVKQQIICGDRSHAHNKSRLENVCEDVLGEGFDEYWVLPPGAGKDLNPCDKDMHSEVQQVFATKMLNSTRSPSAITRAISLSYSNIPAGHAVGWFRRCGLIGRKRHEFH